jgi:ABC-type branched-subunit amino acid transport system ATPase component
MSILTAHHLSKSYGAFDVFDDVTLALAHHQRAALVGAHGAGKRSVFCRSTPISCWSNTIRCTI